MKELKLSTKAGRTIYEKGLRSVGYWLEDVYDRPSKAKQIAYERCFEEYVNTEDSKCFGICSYNTFGFSCAWIGTKDGEPIMRYETKDNSYLIWVNR